MDYICSYLELCRARYNSFATQKRKKILAIRMMCYELFVLFWLIFITEAYPSGSRKEFTSRKKEFSQLELQDIEYNDQNLDYAGRIREIFDFDFGIVDHERENSENCANIICMPHSLCIHNMVLRNGTELLAWRMAKRSKVGKVSHCHACG